MTYGIGAEVALGETNTSGAARASLPDHTGIRNAMNAPALNIAPTAGPGQSAQAAPGVAAADPLAGFGALIEALFPQSAATSSQPVTAQAVQTPPMVAGLLPNEPGAEDEAAASSTDDSVAVDVNAVIAAGLLPGQPNVAPPVPVPLPTGEAPAETATAQGRGAIAQPGPSAFSSSDPMSDDDLADTPTATPVAGPTPRPVSSPAQPLPTPPAVQAANAGPAANTPIPLAAPDTAVDAAAIATPPTPASATALAVAQAPAAPIAAGLTTKPEPVPSSPPQTRVAKSERKTLNGATPSADLAPNGGVAPLAQAKVASGPAKATPAQAEALEPGLADIEPVQEHPDGVLHGEGRAAQASSAPPPGLAAHAARGSPETVANLAAQILKKLEGQATRFDLELNPAGLGKVDVRLEIGAHGALTAAMTFDNPQAAAELRSRAAELQRALEQAGFDLSGGLTFDVAGDRGQQQHRQAWQDQAAEHGGGFRGEAFRAALDTANAADAAGSGVLRLRRGISAGLDLRI